MDAKKKVQELKHLIDTRGLREAMDTLAAMLAERNPAMIQPLLLMRAYRDDDDYVDEMFTIIHCVEGYEPEIYARALVQTSDTLLANSPYFLTELVERVINSEAYAVPFVEALSKIPSGSKDFLRQLMERVVAIPGLEASTIRNANAALDKIGR